ncbi:MAG: hypothetical protein JO241_03845 [Candidatus Eremiobacteraeota bacterium]|nr:hypothetical protein [Candidatus Eremiobacteraeota bacterium]
MNRWEIKRQIESMQPIVMNAIVATILQRLADKNVFTEDEIMQIVVDANRMSSG